MKKKIIISIVVMLALLVSLFGCSTDNIEKEQNPSQEVIVTDSPSAELPNIETSVPSTNSTLENYDVVIKSAELGKDHDGNDVIVITYDWTNNSDDTTSATIALMEQAFQDGIELDRAYGVQDEIYDSELSWKNIRSGATLEVQCAFVLSNMDSPVEIEISELFSFSDNAVIEIFDVNTL